MAWVIPDKRFLKSHCHWFEGEWHRAPPTPPLPPIKFIFQVCLSFT